MIILDAETALAFTEALSIEGVERPTVLIWKSSRRVAALGISQKADVELNIPNTLEDNVHIVRRQSGGGAVILGEGTLCFEVVAPITNTTADLSIKRSFAEYTQPLVNILNSYHLDANVSGISDITVCYKEVNRKVSGCAQLRKKRALVVHASILIDIDKSLLERYLRFPSDVPDYRKSRSHTDFCLNLSEIIHGYTAEKLSNDLTTEFNKFGWDIISTLPPLGDLAMQLLAGKYSQESWNIDRKRPKIS